MTSFSFAVLCWLMDSSGESFVAVLPCTTPYFIEMSTANACHSAHTFRAVQLPEGIRTAFLLLQDFVCRALYPRGQIDDVEFTS